MENENRAAFEDGLNEVMDMLKDEQKKMYKVQIFRKYSDGKIAPFLSFHSNLKSGCNRLNLAREFSDTERMEIMEAARVCRDTISVEKVELKCGYMVSAKDINGY